MDGWNPYTTPLCSWRAGVAQQVERAWQYCEPLLRFRRPDAQVWPSPVHTEPASHSQHQP
eukprot:scaffold320736_cov16-Prasinocladus_malaysianus.AAC.1